MAILTDKQIIRPFIKKSSGYIKSLLSSQHVEMNDGKTLQTAVDEINNYLTYYIVEEITNSYGTYRKWTNGTLEMWGKWTPSVSLINGQYIGLWNNYNCYSLNLPFPYNSLTDCSTQINLESNAYNFISLQHRDKRTSAWFWLCMSSIQTNLTFNFHSFGTWK